MTRPFLFKQHEQTNIPSSVHHSTHGNDAVDKSHVLRRHRSQSYMEALCHLDAGVHTTRIGAEAIMEVMKAEFPELSVLDLPIGIVSKCYLGDPYEVHTLDCAGQIVMHFKRGEPLPSGMEKARSLALHGAYAFVEVYPLFLRAVKEDGSVTVVSN